mgnify:FL=1|jgi:hypothetical protein
MGRVNKLTDGVFTGIVGNASEVSSYDRFINLKEDYATSKESNEFLKEYQTVITENKTVFDKLASLEEIIMQLRSRDNVCEDFKLSIVREYIYARTPFYRRDKGTKDIRVIVGLTEFYGEDTRNLMGNKEFVSKAASKLTDAMDVEISANISQYKKIF